MRVNKGTAFQKICIIFIRSQIYDWFQQFNVQYDRIGLVCPLSSDQLFYQIVGLKLMVSLFLIQEISPLVCNLIDEFHFGISSSGSNS